MQALVGATEVLEVRVDDVVARATVRFAPVSRLHVWMAKLQRASVAEKKRIGQLRAEFSAQEWPDLHKEDGYVTPESLEEQAAVARNILEETIVSVKIERPGAANETFTGQSAAAGLDAVGLLMTAGLRVLEMHKLDPRKRSSPASSAGEGSASTNTGSSPSSPTT